MSCRLEHITLTDRIDLGCAGVLFAGQYGLVTDLARRWDVSRQFIYDLRDRTRTALEHALAPGQPGRSAVDGHLVVDQLAVERATLVLNQVAHASVRAIQECLGAILKVPRSVGAIHAVLAEAHRRALGLLPPAPRALVAVDADEIFAADRPVLEVVERSSGRILALEPAEQRDETTWGCTFLDLAERGVTLASVAADGGTGLRAGARAAGLAEPRLDHWHTLRDLGRSHRALEAEAYRRLEAADRSERAAVAETYRTAHGHRPRRGRPLQAATDPDALRTARQAAEEAIRRADGTAYLLAAVREALRPVDPSTGEVYESGGTTATLHAAAALLREMGGRAMAAARLLEERAVGLVAYLGDLAEAVAPACAALGKEIVHFLAWAWRHRHALDLSEAADAWPDAPGWARQVWVALDQAARGTGMAENLNSVLAPHRAAHRGLPAPVLSVFQVYRNHRVFPRGKRAEQRPNHLAGLPAADWLDVLGYGRRPRTQTPKFPTSTAQTVNTFAA
ncbi:MAG: hypothetical protein GEU73_00250 [Chloroflexi bacterium]|nr:hypothetical protein [Chloroflexota bacterium]